MTKIINVSAAKDRAFAQAMVEVDADIDAERVLIINRLSGETYQNFKLQNNKVMKFIVPIQHSNTHSLLVGILDDDNVYNSEIVDGVKAELINGNIVNVR
ncbi:MULTISPECIES: hypothetical protein [unclassified Shewanella]|uniref:hypothetical protein n=1 Tax=Shewanella TaxID=22 RepID=UPI0021DAEA8C|nr:MULTISPECIES: hypothetical protein [unclassified Shewanella]MCU8043291.1 hypothetical protein [Shewanella sp. SM68]MCU8047665.1 hypothetical protein [Shewanella sp. SM65]